MPEEIKGENLQEWAEIKQEIKIPKQQEITKTVEDFQFQERDPFEDFMGHIDQDAERRKPTEEEKQRMDSNLIQLGKIFEGSDIKWQIDGGLNISLVKGEYIGIHKDVDISIEESELEKIDAQLKKTGYGLFLSHLKNPKEPKGKKVMERVSAKKFSEAEQDHLMIASVDEKGKIKEGKTLNFIDVHLIKRNNEGKPTGWSGVELPEKWFEPQPTTFQGQEVNLSHPAKTAYFKLHGTRNYDQTDLQKLVETGSLTLEDVGEIQQAFNQESLIRKDEAETLIGRVADNLNPEMTADEIFEVFAEEPRIAKSLEHISDQLKVLCQKVETSDKSKDVIMSLTAETFNFAKAEAAQQNKIDELKRWVEENMQIKQLKDGLETEK